MHHTTTRTMLPFLFFILSQASAVPAPQYSYNANNPKTDGNSNIGDQQRNGADGSSASYAGLSIGALIAIGVVAVLVILGGIASGVLFYIAKKRQWQVRQTIRRKASQIFTPRIDRFPSSVKHQQRRDIAMRNAAGKKQTKTSVQQRDEKSNTLAVKVVETETSSTGSASADSTPEKHMRSSSRPVVDPVVTDRQNLSQQQEEHSRNADSQRDSNTRRQQRWSQFMGKS